MPWTVSHAAAVLPLRRLGPLRLDLPALVVGSMAPDAPFYVGLPGLSLAAHAPAGSVLVAWPLGLGLLALLAAIRRPLCHLLPQPHRDVVGARFAGPLHWRPVTGIRCGVSMLIGIWTHLLCDLLTHAPPAGIAWLRWLGAPVATIDGMPLLAHTVLQVTSSALGAGVLLLAYRRWLRQRLARSRVGRGGKSGSPDTADGPVAADGSSAADGPGAARNTGPKDGGDRWRWGLQALMLLGCGAVGVAFAAATAPPIETVRDLEHQVFRALVMATTLYLPWLVVAALLAHALARRPGPRRD